MSQGFPELTPPGGKPVINSIFDFSDAALGQLRLWLEQNPPAVPITSILGFSQFTAQLASVSTTETTTSTTYADLATAGPTLSGLPDGRYLYLVDVTSFNSAAGNACISGVTINGSAPADDTKSAINTGTDQVSAIGAGLATLSAGSNTLKVQYRVNAGTGSFSYRNLIALRYANK